MKQFASGAALAAILLVACGATAPNGPQRAAEPPSGLECTNGTADCDGKKLNGCETSTSTSSTHCGACGQACAGDEICVNGACRVRGRRIALGGHACVVRPSGRVACWGDNAHGQLGDGTTTTPRAPVLVTGVTDAVSLAFGYTNTYALRDNGEVFAWGSNSYGECDPGSSEERVLVPRRLGGLARIVAIAGGHDFGCAVRNDGALLCWGTSRYLDLGETLRKGRAPPTPIGTVTDARSIAIGANHLCVGRKDGTIVCWGLASDGALGRASTAPAGELSPAVGIDDAVGIEVGRHSCALHASGQVSCWGFNDGALGDGTIASRSTPTKVVGVRDARYLETNSSTDGGCVVRRDGKVACWGRVAEPFPSLAPGRLVPELVPTLSGVQQISTTRRLACALMRTGKVSCWGDAAGIGRIPESLLVSTPGPVSSLTDAIGLSIGEGHGCAVQKTGSIVCWGENDHGQLGVPDPGPYATPVSVPGLVDAVSVSAGSRHSCAVRRNGTVACWGRNRSGELGDGTLENRAAPVAVEGLEGVTLVAAGGSSTCAATNNGNVLCWGDLELNTSEAEKPKKPTLVRGLTRPKRLFADELSAFGHQEPRYCAIDSKSRLWCWGRGGKPNAFTARAMKKVDGVRHGILRGYYACVVRASGVSCDVPVYDQISTDPKQSAPRPHSDSLTLSDARAVALGGNATCVVHESGTVDCFGANDAGQLGNGSFDSSWTSVSAAVGVSDAVDIASGDGFFCALTRPGRVMCWGRNARGRLGNGRMAQEVVTTPVDVPLPD